VSRKNAREIALHLIFEYGFGTFEAENVREECLSDEIMSLISGEIALYAGKLSEAQTNYIVSVVTGVAEHLEELDKTIQDHAKGWSFKRLSRITVALLRLAIFEMRYVEDVPTGAAINEAVELAKVYDSTEAASFINGILGSVSRMTAE
jgi:N utilization substance protein B